MSAAMPSLMVLRHEPYEHLGHFATILEEHGIPFVYKDLGDPLQLGLHTGVIVMGGPQSANDLNPGLAEELRLIDKTFTHGIPVLGVCLGAQLIAKALGARVYKNEGRELGWAPVYLTDQGMTDPLFASLDSPTDFFHWHAETFDLPQGALWLAYSDRCRHQAFRYGEVVYGVQFHPEITPEMMVDWSLDPVNCGEGSPLEAPIDPYAFDSLSLARSILDGWLNATGLLAARKVPA